ncbi:putative methyltransferase YcgJ [Methylacidimicrobium cyclopophantes]|uniref:Methyltransferase YcgJ n=1 Tax=Methylacidimicrobium cyclopophantes TaxID=1041766 RepID=A0A5E6MK32_9BACT|nr:class I SAM-dependent methyltransferase [Methylacidimicrobium cyclopophantes]VVM06417.1 putative methyltransferase YcgJ [Methylacidimicrobium cyclopophantes]
MKDDEGRNPSLLFPLGDYLAGIFTGTLVAAAVRSLVAPGFDMALAMVLGMVVGMVIHLLLGFVLGPLLGMFQTMIPGSWIGMYGGMLFAMRDSMGAGSHTWVSALGVGALFGGMAVGAFHLYDRILRGPVNGPRGREVESAGSSTRKKWDAASRFFDRLTWADDRRFGPEKRRLFAGLEGRLLFIGAGTGNDFRYLPPGLSVTAIDISPSMLAQASAKAAAYEGKIELREADVQRLDFPDDSFDEALAVCTFCSVPDPLLGLREVYRVLKPGGRFFLFEHVRSRIGPVGILLDLMTPLSRLVGPALNRETVSNVKAAGFSILGEENVYLDIVKWIEARKPRE